MRPALLLPFFALAAAALPAAADVWDECRQKALAGPGTWGCHCFYSVGKSTGDWQRARRELERLPPAPQDPFRLFTFGRIADALGGCASSEELFAKAAELFAAAGERQGETYARGNRLRCLESRDLAAARAESRRLYELAVATGEPALEARAALRMAQVAISALALDEAEALLAGQPLTKLDALGPAENLGEEWLLQHGRLSLALGRVEAALGDAEERLARARARGDRAAIARAAYDLAAMSTSLPASAENAAATREAAAAALTAAEASGERGVLVMPLLLAGRLDGDLGKLDRCGTLAKETGDLHHFVACRFAAAAALAESAAGGLEVGSSTETGKNLKLDGAESPGRIDLSRLQEGSRDPKGVMGGKAPQDSGSLPPRPRGGGRGRGPSVRETAQSASVLAENLLAEGLAAARGNADPLVMLQPWADYLRALFALRPRGEAIAAGEALLAEAEKVRSAETRPDRRAQLFGVWRELHDWLAGRLLAGGDPEEAREAFRILEAGRARELRESLAKDTAPRDLTAIEADLAADTALLTFHLDFARDLYGRPGGGGAVFVSTRAGTRVVAFPDRQRADTAIALLLGAVASRQDTAELEQRVGGLLFGPLEEQLSPEVRRLVMVPAGSLFRLPWAMLRDASGRRLGERFEIVVAPAASLPHREIAPGRGGALIFADPAFAAVTPASSPLEAARGSAPVTLGRELPRLPFARAEGREVFRRLGGESREDAAASEAALRAAPLADFAVLHFAAHAVLDDELPERSALLLAPGGGDDGRLEPKEIAALPLAGQLVTLAGCRSALGRILRGEGPLSLGRAFLAAGAPAVVGSLWDLQDQEAATFFRRFYRHLAQGEKAAAALRATQNEIAAGGAPPAAWAGVVLLGDGEFRLAPRSPLGGFWRGYRQPLLGLAGIAALAIVFIWRRQR